MCVIFSFNRSEYFFIHNYGFVRGCLSFIVGYFVWGLSHLKFKLSDYFEILIVPLLLLILFTLHNLDGTSRQLFGLFVIPTFFGAVILVLLRTNGILSKVLESTVFSILGDISYSVYLNHIFIIALVTNFFFKTLKIANTGMNQLFVVFAVFIILIGYSKLTYSLIEKKGGDLLRKKIFKE